MQIILSFPRIEYIKLTHHTISHFHCPIKINKVARENNMNIIFAVTSNRNETYQLLSRSIRGSSIGAIERNSRNVVALVSGEYEVFHLDQFRVLLYTYTYINEMLTICSETGQHYNNDGRCAKNDRCEIFLTMFG